MEKASLRCCLENGEGQEHISAIHIDVNDRLGCQADFQADTHALYKCLPSLATLFASLSLLLFLQSLKKLPYL